MKGQKPMSAKVNEKPYRCLTTLCYIEQDGKYLMLHRVKKENDVNKDKWVGIGGHFEENESPEECLLREVREETGLQLISYRFRGIITFISDRWDTEYMHLFTADKFDGSIEMCDDTGSMVECGDTGNIAECDEGELCWVEKSKVYDLPIWEGDKIFFRLLDEREDFFSLKLRYEREKLVEAILDGKSILQPC